MASDRTGIRLCGEVAACDALLLMSPSPIDPAVLRRIYAVRREVRLRDARPNDGRCGNVTSALSSEFGWAGEWGYLRLLDDTVSWVHCWNRLPDGTILDATADQYQDLWLGDVVVLPATDPLAANYLHAPATWELRFDQFDGGPSVVCVAGDDVRTVTCEVERQWESLARGVLRVVCGWELPSDLVDLAARALRARASAETRWTSAELTHVLLNRGIQHLGNRGELRPWVAAEFLDPF
jgi:hypothetical protein